MLPINSETVLESLVCPDITLYWQTGYSHSSQQWLLAAEVGLSRYSVSEMESYALQYFTGRYSAKTVQRLCEKKFGDEISPNLVEQLLDKLLAWGVLQEAKLASDRTEQNQGTEDSSISPRFKEIVEWIAHPKGHWILRNLEDFTYLQIDRDRGEALSHLGEMSLKEISQKHQLALVELNEILQILAAMGMLEGTHPAKPPKKKFTPLQLLFFKVPLFNPDRWLQVPTQFLYWIWTKPFFLLLLCFLVTSLVFGLNERSQILYEGEILWQTQGALLILPFALLSMLVITIHEFAHALTLKHYGGIVPEIGLLFMVLIPAAYTNTSDSYCLIKRRQRALVVGAGVLCQLTIGAISFWLWHFAVDNSWLKPTSYLLMVAALLTVFVNLNPMSKFDGYHLAVALTEINNLRDRSFKFYATLLQGKGIEEHLQDCDILAIYAPLSLLYILLVFGSILRFIIYWILDNASITMLFFLLAWSIYFFFPRGNRQ